MPEKVIRLNVRNERAVLSTLMQSRTQRKEWIRKLDANLFLDERHQTIVDLLLRMEERKLEWSEDTAEMMAGGRNFGGVDYVRKIVAEYKVNENLDAHVARLRTDALKHRLLTEAIPRLVEAIEDPTSDRDELWGPATRLTRILEDGVDRAGHHGKRLVDGYFGRMAERKAMPEFISTGFDELDERMTFGFAPGHLTLLVARPGVGKSSLMAEVIRRRITAGLGSQIFALDMTFTDYIDLIVAAETGISQQRLIRNAADLTLEERRSIVAAVRRLEDPTLLDVVENPFSKREDAELAPWKRNARNMELFEAYLADGGYPLVVVDVANQLLADRRADAVRDSVQALVGLARTYHVHLLILHHTGRDQEGRPTMEDIRSSGGWEEFTRTILALDRPALRKKGGGKDVLDIGCLKQTKGPAPWWIRYDFDGACCTFSNGRVLAGGSEGIDDNEGFDDGPPEAF